MNNSEVMGHLEKYWPGMCRNITWAIINNGHQYFSQRLHPDNVKKRIIPFPFSRLGEHVTDVVYGRNPTCLSFPDPWKQIAPVSGEYSTGGCRPNGGHNQLDGRGQGGCGGRGYQGSNQEQRPVHDGIGYVASKINQMVKD